jgi:hypothetical protein
MEPWNVIKMYVCIFVDLQILAELLAGVYGNFYIPWNPSNLARTGTLLHGSESTVDSWWTITVCVLLQEL